MTQQAQIEGKVAPSAEPTPPVEEKVTAGIAAVASRNPIEDDTDRDDVVVLDHVSCFFNDRKVVDDVTLHFKRQRVTALIGPSGCGKSTVLRTINRMHELSSGRPRMTGQVLLDGENIMASGVDAVAVRRRIGMVFQKPNPFPAMSIFDNVIAGLKLNSWFSNRRKMEEVVERSLLQAALW